MNLLGKYYNFITRRWLQMELPMNDIERLRQLVRQGKTLQALALSERLNPEEENSPLISLYAYCIARERGQIRKAIELCRRAIQSDPENTTHYYFLGKIHLLSGNKKMAIEVFRQGLTLGPDQDIISELNKLGIRKPPPIKFLKRSNPVNKYLGLFLSRLNLR
jgi:tetratricopeptide (TPR) repeat protein